MKSFQYFLSVLTNVMISLVSSGINDPHKLTAVSDRLIAAKLYRRILDNTPVIEPPPPLDPDTKLRICHHITGSEIFVMEGKKRIYMPEIFDHLRENEHTVFKNLYEISAEEPSTSTSDVKIEYSNPTVVIDVQISMSSTQSFKEFAFLCLVGDDSLPHKVLREYYVSDEYNLSDDETPDVYIPGRFIFVQSDSLGTYMFGVAEEPAQTLSKPGHYVELKYLQRRQEKKRARRKDPLSGLHIEERLRLCMLVFKSTHFDGELVFVEEEKAVDEFDTFKKEIIFQDEGVQKKLNDEVYYEQVIRCKPKRYFANYQSEYFVSQAYRPTEVFVFRAWGDKIAIENLFGSIRFRI